MAIMMGNNWDLALKRKSSLRRGNHMHFFKIIPSNLTIDQAKELTLQRQFVFKSKSSLLKLKPDFLFFYYISENIIRQEVINELGNFEKVVNNYFGAVFQLNFLNETRNGTYESPSKIGIWWGYLKIRAFGMRLKR